jgi:hypothetical protein
METIAAGSSGLPSRTLANEAQALGGKPFKTALSHEATEKPPGSQGPRITAIDVLRGRTGRRTWREKPSRKERSSP